MRHGSVAYFDAAGNPFPPDAVPLTELGRAQADAAGRLFAQQAIRFDRVIVSGLPRTVETATRVLAATGQAIAIDTWPAFAELRGGRLGGIADADLKAAFTGAFEGVVPEDTQFLGGETVGQLMDRVFPALARLRADSGWDTALLVLHGGVNRAILSRALTGQRLFLGNIAQTAGCINALDVGELEHDWVLRFANLAPAMPLQQGARDTTM
ncbi:MAG TPA: histidine phosphatase family protein [Janthinobacterium sp.]|nr:histidine phosphatase family protein [Janthinobacterium sp.]